MERRQAAIRAFFYSVDGINLLNLIQEGDAVPLPDTGNFGLVRHIQVSDALGNVYFASNITGGASPYSDTGIWQDDGTLNAVVREGEVAVTVDQNWYGQIDPFITAAGEGVAFIASLQSDPAGFSDPTMRNDVERNEGVFKFDGSTVSEVVRKGDEAPGTDGATFGSFLVPSGGAAGQVAFIGILNRGSGVRASSDYGIWSDAGGTLELVVRENDISPVTKKFESFEEVFVDATGKVWFRAFLRAGGAIDEGIFSWTSAGGLQLELWEGSDVAVNEGTAELGTFQNFAVSPGGVAILQALLDDGTVTEDNDQALFRNSGSGWGGSHPERRQFWSGNNYRYQYLYRNVDARARHGRPGVTRERRWRHQCSALVWQHDLHECDSAIAENERCHSGCNGWTAIDFGLRSGCRALSLRVGDAI